MAKEYTEEEANAIFDRAIELSESSNTLFLGAIAYVQKVPKKLYFDLVDKYEDLEYKYDLIMSNCEAKIFEEMKHNRLDNRFGMFTLESQHGWNKDSSKDKPVTIRVEGVTTEEIEDLLNEDNDGV